MIKLVVSDMDGTLINHEQGISKKNLNAIKELEERNIDFAIASGRDYNGVYTIMHKYDLHCEAILGNGAQYVDKAGNVLMSCYLNKQVFQDIITIFHEANIPYMVFTTDGFFTTQEPHYVRDSFITRGKIRFGMNDEAYIDGGSHAHIPCNHLQKITDIEAFLEKDLEIIKVEAFSLTPSELIPAKELLKPIPTISYLSSFDDNVEVTNQNAQKGLILEKVAKLKGLKKEEIMVLGDGMNYLSVFRILMRLRMLN